MSTAQDHVIAFGVDCRRIGEDAWSYVSLAPWPQLAPDGSAMLGIIRAGDYAIVQLSAQLDPPGRMLEQLRMSLAAGANPAGANPALIRLTSGITRIRSVDVTVGAGDDAQIVATSAGSGFPPFTAAFSVTPTEQNRAAFEAALTGETGRVAITYDAETDRGPARIGADLADWTRKTNA